MNKKLVFEKDKSPARSLTPFSNTSSNNENLIYDIDYRTTYGLQFLSKQVDDDYLRLEKQYNFKSTSTLEDSIISVLESLEIELKKIDYNFGFKKIEESVSVAFTCIREAAAFLSSKVFQAKRSPPSVFDRRLSGEMCQSCLKMKNLMEEAKFSIEREKESLENTEKHLKHYDSLLAIKENRLREQETAFENEKKILEIQKTENSKEKLLIDKDKESIKLSYTKLKMEKDEFEKQMETLEKKYQDVKKILNDYESQKSNIENTIRSETFKNIETRENAVKAKEAEIAKQHEDLKQKVRQYEKLFNEKSSQLDKLKQDIVHKQKKITEKKEKILEINSSLAVKKEKSEKIEKELRIKYEQKMKDLSTKEDILTTKASEIDTLYIRLNEERSRLEALTRTLQDQKEELDQNLSATKRITQEKIYQAQLAEERYRERYLQTEFKEKKLEEMITAVQEEERKLEERWNCLENIENLSIELENLKEKYASLQKTYFLQQEELKNLRENNQISMFEASEDLKFRIESIERKEEELQELEHQLKRERKDIDMNTALINQLNEDLNKQKQIQSIEQKKLLELASELKAKENNYTRVEISNIEPDKSFKNSSTGSIKAILVSDMSPFDEKDIFLLENPFSSENL
jgi:hypothetical protein